MTMTACPDDSLISKDGDSDGIIDTSDACPLEPETYNGFQDDDGCPDVTVSATSSYNFPDVDGDRVDDRWDSCIDEQENYNGYLDWDGCPDVLGAESTAPTTFGL